MNYLVKYFFTLFAHWSLRLTKTIESSELKIKKWLLSVSIFFASILRRSECLTKNMESRNLMVEIMESNYCIRVVLIEGVPKPDWFDDS